jgi:hypothetical protein
MPERLVTHFAFAAGLAGLLAIVLPAVLMVLTGGRP